MTIEFLYGVAGRRRHCLWTGRRRELDGQKLNFRFDGEKIVDEGTGSEWNVLGEARALADGMLARFSDEDADAGGFFDTASDHADRSLIIRPKNITDNAIPSGNAVAAAVLLDLAILDGPSTSSGRAETYHRRALETLRLLGGAMARHPRAFGQALSALDATLASTKEIVIIGDPQAAATQALLETVHGRHLPNKVLVVARPDQVDELSQCIPLLAGRTQVDGMATVYVCENYTCGLPVAEPEPLLRLLEAAERRCSQ